MVYGMVSWSHGVRNGEPLAQWPVVKRKESEGKKKHRDIEVGGVKRIHRGCMRGA